jgi:hypothetical protein
LKQNKYLHEFYVEAPLQVHMPFLPSFTTFLCQSDEFLQSMCFFILKLKSSQHISWNHLWHINNIWTLRGSNMTLQKVSTIPKFHET